ncbi:DEAD/DEAH box helicase family protein [Candidatus Latescibacterota bacterium]
MANPTPCPFCFPNPDQLIREEDLVLALWDKYPVARGHALLVPRRHIPTITQATVDERTALFDLLGHIRRCLDDQYHPAGYNIGINEGQAAGQTVQHLHIHLIPRYAGDVPDPTGGVRFVIPERANYLQGDPGPLPDATAPPHHNALVTGTDDPLLPHLRAHLDLAHQVDIAVAFTMVSGLTLIYEHLRDLLDRGGSLRFLTGDYLDVTEPGALRLLLDLAAPERSCLDLRVFHAAEQSFHPKAYIFRQEDDSGTAIVGSSNLSATALGPGVEWNYRIITSRDQTGFASVSDAFERLYAHPATATLDEDWIRAYDQRHKPATRPVPPEQVEPPPEPHAIQTQALRKLATTREAGNRAGLVVLATGLGKTWLSAFDSEQFRRVLFIAHREEILDQALGTFRRIRPDARLGKYTGTAKDKDADILFASVQTLSRQQHLRQFPRDHFDYLVMDEFHHAAAATYRRLLDYFDPEFLLGLTATPERTDGGDLLALCQENLVYRCDIAAGIEEGLLCPFHYYGVPDEVDYTNIPWRSRRFDEQALTEAVATQSRAQNALEQWQTHAGDRTMAFCCSTRHATFMRDFFRQQGIPSAAVHSDPDSDPRAASLERLASNDLDVVFSVDMFNEGIDLPAVDTIMMLRPTESRILWLQQFGRGLRQTPTRDKTLTVVDYIGNHRSFLLKPEALLHALFNIGPGEAPLRAKLEELQRGQAELPPGCEITYELSSIDILRSLFRPDSGAEARHFYETFREDHEQRPMAAEVYHSGYNPRTLGKLNGSWLHFVDSMGDMSSTHKVLLAQRAGRFVTHLESTQMTKSFKMVTLLAVLRRDALPGQIGIEGLTEEFARVASRSEYLAADVTTPLTDTAALRQLIEQNPINAWTGAAGTGGEVFFEYEDGVFRCNLELPEEQRSAFQELVRELVEWRLAAYLDRAPNPTPDRIVCKVSHAGGRPILFLPDREKQPGLPEGTVAVLVDGEEYEADFVKIAVNVMRRVGETENRLPEVLRGWFGEGAGRPGTTHRVVFTKEVKAYRLAPQTGVRDDPV